LDARRKRENKEGREAKLLRGACVQTAFHAEQTKLWPLSDFPSEFFTTAAADRGDAMATWARAAGPPLVSIRHEPVLL